MEMDAYGQLKPRGPLDWYARPSAAFSGLCPFSPAAANEDEIALARFPEAPSSDRLIGRFEAAYVGHAEEGDFRRDGSSGGLVTWVAVELLEAGLIDAVLHVGARGAASSDDPLFGYRISRSVAETRTSAKSRYHPIEMSEVLREVRTVPARYLIIGVPCFIKAIQLLREQDAIFRERIVYTLGLFCGHMKSARMTESFAWQMGAEGRAVEQIDYRLKDPGRPANWYKAEIVLEGGERRAQDWWNFVDGDWGAGFFQNSACDFCDDVTAETADIAFGDAWIEPYSSDGRGTNVVVIRAPELDRLLREAMTAGRISLSEVDAEFVRSTQAAGLRHRREGLAYRLALSGNRLARKRVEPGRGSLSLRRRAVYRMRAHISLWSGRLFRLARVLHRPGLYLIWARLMLRLYQALTYSRGRLGSFMDFVERSLRRSHGQA